MKKLSQLLESINEIDSLLELDFKDKKAFQKYQSIHKMKPTTKVNIAGKDTTVGDEMGDDSETPEAPKKTTGADIEKQADKSGKETDDIEKDIAGDLMGDEPESEKADAIDSALKRISNEVDIEDFEGSPNNFDALMDIASDLEDSPIGDDEEFGDLYDDLMGNQDTESAENFKKYLDDQLKGDKPKSEPKSLFSQVSDENKDEFMDVVSDIDSNSGLDTINVDKSKGGSGTYYNNITLPALKKKFPGGGDEFYEGIDQGIDSAIDSLGYIEDKKLKKKLEDELFTLSNDMMAELGDDYEAAVDGDGKLPYKKMLPYLEKLDKFKKEHFSDESKSKDEPTTKFQGRTIPKAPKYDTKKKTGSKKPSSLDSYYAKEDAKKKWLSSNPGKTSYDWSRLPYGTMSDLIDKEMKARGFKENTNLKELSKITTRYNKWLN